MSNGSRHPRHFYIVGIAIVALISGLIATAAFSPRFAYLFQPETQVAGLHDNSAETTADMPEPAPDERYLNLNRKLKDDHEEGPTRLKDKISRKSDDKEHQEADRDNDDVDLETAEHENDKEDGDEAYREEAKFEVVVEQQNYWLDRLTYPTGRFNPEWVRNAAAQDSRVSRDLPFGSDLQRGGPDTLDINAFTALGPAPENMTGCTGCFDYGKTQGRINAIVIDPTTTIPGSIAAYSATIGGGVWKTTNCCTAATSWTLVTDDPLISTTSIDTLAMDPRNHNVVYAGTGDLNFGSFSMGSQGILKTTDAGATWVVLAPNIFGAAYTEPAGQFPQYDAVGKVRVDPNNSNRVVAGTKKGIFLSYDAGANWTGPCVTNNLTTQRQDTTGLELSDMGNGVTRILVAVGTRGFASTVQYDLGNQGANGLYGGTMPLSGCPTNFTLLTRNDNGFVFGTAVTGSPYTTGALMNAGSGVPYSNITTGTQMSRMDIAVAPSNPNYIYAQVGSIAPNNNSGCGNAAGCQLGVWSSTDGGTTWAFMTGSAGGSLRACSTGGTQVVGSGTAGGGDYPQNWYDQGMAVDPNNPDRVFIDTFDTWLAHRTGTALYNVTCGYAGSPVANHVVHVDHHALAFVPGSSSVLLNGNDGGVFATMNAHQAAEATLRPTWVNMDNGLNTIEFYAGDISGNFNNAAEPHAVGGAQDNGPSSVKFAGSPAGPMPWQMGLGGDGFSGQINTDGTGPTAAVGAITLVTGGAVAGETFTIGGQVFTFQVAARSGPGQVTLNSSTTTQGTNMVTAITADIPTSVLVATRSGAVVTVTATAPGAAGNSIVFTESATNMTMNGTGFLGGTTQGGLPGTTQPVVWQGNNSGGLSRCTANCTNPGASWSSRPGGWSGDQQSFVLPINLFHGGIPGGDDCPTGCGRLIAGTTRVWETITGNYNAFWYITNNPAGAAAGPNLTKGTLGNRSYINQVKYSPKYYSVAIAGTNDGNVQIGFNLGTGVANQANWVNVTGSNAILPNRPILGIALDPSVPAVDVPVGYAAVGGFNANTPSTPGHVFQVSCGSNCASFTWANKSGNLPDIPVDSIIVNPNYPQMVFAGTDFGLYFTNDITAVSPTWSRFSNGLPAVMIWDMQIDRGSTTLSLWTRGRGAFVWPLPFGVVPTPSPTASPTPTPACADVVAPVMTSRRSATGFPVSISIQSTDVTDRGVIGGDFTFTYDPAVLSPSPANISITPGAISPTGQVTYNASVPGTIVVSIFNSTPFSGAGSVVDIHMKVIGQLGSVSPLTLTNFRYNGGVVCSTMTSGTLTVVGGAITGRVSFENIPYPSPTVLPTPLPVTDTQITATGGSTFSATTNASGNYTLSGFGPGAYTVTPSKPNQNFMVPNGILSSDPSLVAQHVVGLITLNAVQQRAADVSGVHTLSSFDAGLIAQWIVGITNPINQTGQWKFTPASTTPDTSVDGTQNYLGLLMGDVNGDWSPFVMRLMAGERSAEIIADDISISGAVRASVPNTKAMQGSSVSIPFRIDNLRGSGIASYQFDIEYDPAVITPDQLAADLAGTMSEGMALAVNSPMPGLLKVVVYGAVPITNDGVFVNLHFKAIGAAGSTSPLTINGLRLDDARMHSVTRSGVLQVTAATR